MPALRVSLGLGKESFQSGRWLGNSGNTGAGIYNRHKRFYENPRFPDVVKRWVLTGDNGRLGRLCV